jgi:hypothetical protein
MRHPIKKSIKNEDGTLPDYKVFGSKKYKLLGASYDKYNAEHTRKFALAQGARVRSIRRIMPDTGKIAYLTYVRKEGSKIWS